MGVDARAHLTDVVTHAEVSSAPVSTGEMLGAAKDATAWGNGPAAKAAGRQIGGAA